jgi:hypothetical protein
MNPANMNRGWIARTGVALALVSPAGCATPPRSAAVQAALTPAATPLVVTREVVVKVPVEVKAACVPRSLPPAPRYPDTASALRTAGGAADRYQLLAAGRILRARRLAVLERVIDGCR